MSTLKLLALAAMLSALVVLWYCIIKVEQIGREIEQTERALDAALADKAKRQRNTLIWSDSMDAVIDSIRVKNDSISAEIKRKYGAKWE